MVFHPLFLLLFFLCLPSLNSASGLARRDPISLAKRLSSQEVQELAATGLETVKYKWTEEWYHQMPLDHFNFGDNRTFSLRFLTNLDSFRGKNAPIFFYTGNEGQIESFAENTGFMFDLAPEFGAAVVFAEHRYYGKSLPFGNDSYANASTLAYLSSEQALADFAVFLTYLKEQRLPNARRSPVIAFGGSYGGMLTAWMRVKYPHLVDGGIAASAPVLWFANAPVPPEHSYDDIVTRTFLLSGCTLDSLTGSFEAIRALAKSVNGRRFLNQNFRLAPDSRVEREADGELLLGSVKDVMETMSMVDYPYPTNFLGPLPDWPVKVACKAFAETAQNSSSRESKALASYQMLNLFYNYTGKTPELCLWGSHCPGSFGALGADIWNWQACTEMVMPMCSRGPPFDPFGKSCPYSSNDSLRWCLGAFRSRGYSPALFRPDWALINYGAEFPTASNLVFSNGWLDPWSGGGWRLKPAQQGSLVSLIVEDGAHHYDLRGWHPTDTQSVKEVRALEKMHIENWIQQARERQGQRKKVTKERILRSELNF